MNSLETSPSPALLAQIASLPALPGVYRYFDSDNALLYVGKAINLKKRVSSYFQREAKGTRIGHMVSKIAHLETTVVRSEADALILESNLIKTQNPKYNILFRDDKSYPYLKFSVGTEPRDGEPIRANQYSRMSYYRGATEKKNYYFGPYPSAGAVKETIALMQKIFRLRTCEDSVFNNRSRPCLLYQIKRCTAPCVNLISWADYTKQLDLAHSFLRGDSLALLENFQTQMQGFSEALAFEKAAMVRDQIQALSTMLHQQSMESLQIQDVDIIALENEGDKFCVNLAMVRGGRHLGDRAFFPSNVKDNSAWSILESDTESTNHVENGTQDDRKSVTQQVLETFLLQHYANLPAPQTLILSESIDKANIDALTILAKRQIHIVLKPQTERRAWLEMAQKNAKIQLERRLSEEGSERQRTQLLAQALDMPDSANELEQIRIECFDISHTQGEATQASCVVFAKHQMQPTQYRRYRIEGITGGDDYAAMRKVLERRYRQIAQKLKNRHPSIDEPQETQAPKIENQNPTMPTLVLIDGGKGQISSAKAVFENLGLDISILVGVEKGEGRKVGLEELVFADGREKIYLGANSQALMLIAQIRDEAHRFAITGMRAARSRTRTGKSRLEDIVGVGPKRRAALLRRFGGLQAVANASVEDLASVEGISHELAEQIYNALR